MMKFFRKYNKQLLAVFMALLMIVFIGGSALQQMMQPSQNHAVANSKYGQVMLMDQTHATATTSLLSQIGLSWQRLAGAEKPIEIVDWILLQREAQALGVTVTPEVVQSSPLTDTLSDRISQLARNLRIRKDEIYVAIAQLLTVEQAAGGAAGSVIPSDAELDITARNALEKVKIQAVMLPAHAFVDPNQQFSDAEMKAHLDKYREREKGAGLNFGYYQGIALKAQYIQINRDAIMAGDTIPNLEKKARQFYDDRRDKDPRFRRPADDKPSDPFRDGQFVGPPPLLPPYVDWEQAKDMAINAVKKQHADEAAAQLADWILKSTAEPWGDSERGKDGYRMPPQSVSNEDYYKSVIEHIPPEKKYPNAVTVGATSFFTEKKANNMTPIAVAMYKSEHLPMPLSFRQLAFRSKPAVPEVTSKEGNQGDYTALYQTSQYPLTHLATGDVFIFRIVDSKPAHAPDSVDEVRDELIADMRLQKGFDAAKAKADALFMAHVTGDSLKVAFEKDADLVAKKETDSGHELGYFDPVAFSRVPMGQAAHGRMPDGIKVPQGVGPIPNSVIDKIFAMKPNNVESLEVPERAVVMVAEFKEILLSPQEEFEKMKKELVTQLTYERRSAAMKDWLDPDKIRARTGFALITR
ncbi:MAG: hypothetical protein HY287_08655 [Planctomycetes bacterium]|nr:hypothetical protein [Planctomycetota bacterium]MBI3834383.1 hypothetical protein [Planctomycetota bacterium]